MNILPKKSWHVRNKDNIAKVRRDEENARLEEEKLAKRAALAEQEARTKLLRDKVHHGEQEHASIQGPSSTSILPYNESQTRHINLFQDEESGTAQSKTTNQEYEAEKKAEQEKKEKALGVLKYLGQSTAEGEKPWYLNRDSKDENMSKTQSSKDVDKKNRLDPLGKMSSFLEKTKKSEQKKKEKLKKEKRHKEKAKKGKKTVEELRAERLQREKEERFREAKLVRESKEGKAGKKEDVEEDPYKGRYHSQYNPDLAKKPKWNSRYQPY